MEKKIYVVRHCQAQGQQAFAPLTEQGIKQAQQLSEFLASHSIDRIISSPFLRAVQSIEPLSMKNNVTIEIDERLQERILSDKDMPDWLEKLKESFQNFDLSFEGGESNREATNRATAVVKEILANEYLNTLMVTHGNLLSLLLHHYDSNFGFEEWKQLTNPDVFLFRFRENQADFERIWME